MQREGARKVPSAFASGTLRILSRCITAIINERERSFGRKPMLKFLSLGLVAAMGMMSSGCVSYSKTERTVPPPAPTPVIERTVYSDGTYVDRPATR